MTTFNRPRPMSDLIPGLTKDIFGKKNLLFGKMLAQWHEIAGPEIAARTVPLDLKFQRKTEAQKEAQKGAAQAVLHLGVSPAHALELSYQKGLLIERLNVFFGYPAIRDIKIIQNSEIMNNNPISAPPLRPLTLQEQQTLSTKVAKVEDPELQAALQSLGRAMLSRRGGRE